MQPKTKRSPRLPRNERYALKIPSYPNTESKANDIQSLINSQITQIRSELTALYSKPQNEDASQKLSLALREKEDEIGHLK